MKGCLNKYTVNLIAAFLSCFLMLHAYSAYALSCIGGDGIETIPLPATVGIPRDAAPGSVFTPWFKSSERASLFNCESASPQLTGARIIHMGAYSPLDMAVPGPDGVRLTKVIATNVKGVGLALAGRVATCDGWSEWQSFDSEWPTVAAAACRSTGSRVGAQIAFALVKTEALISPGALSVPTFAVETVGQAKGNWKKRLYRSSNVIISSYSCITPGVTVNLGRINIGRFKRIGTTSPAVTFVIRLNSCPPGMNKIRFRLDPTTKLLNEELSVVDIYPEGATGIGVQLQDGTGKMPIPFGTFIDFPFYDPAQGGYYSIWLKVAYYQTARRVTPGYGTSSMRFTIEYQ